MDSRYKQILLPTRLLSDLKLNAQQALVLTLVSGNPCATNRELGDCLGLNMTCISKHLKHLQELELVKIKYDTARLGACINYRTLTLTPKAKKYFTGD